MFEHQFKEFVVFILEKRRRGFFTILKDCHMGRISSV